MLAQQRTEYILQQLRIHGCVNVRELANALDVTEVTIRRDLEELEKQGYLQRVHGGATSLAKKDILSKSDESNMEDRLQVNFDKKEMLCRRAASYIKDGDCIFLDGGTTIYPILPYLQNKKIKIVTHSTLITKNFDSEVAELFSIGGKIIPEYQMAVGPIAIDTIKRFNFDYAFIGCAGIDLENKTVYTAEMDTMLIKELAMKQSLHKFLLVDASKKNIKGFCSFTSSDEFDKVFCDEAIEHERSIDLPENFIVVRE